MRNENNKIFRLMLLILIFSSCIHFFSFITADPDLWGHIKFGQDLWSNKSIPYSDNYSFTSDGKRWINHEWISELIMFCLFNQFGSPGLLLGKLFVGFILISILLRVSFYRNSDYLVNCIVFITAIFIISPGFMTRPQLATFLFVTINFYVFHLYLEKNINFLWVLPIIMILWVNSHGGFLIGMGIFPVIIIAEAFSFFTGKREFKFIRTMIFWCILTELSALINPYGINLMLFLFDSLSVSRNITEWDAVRIGDLSYIRLKVFTLLIIAAFFINPRKNRYWEVAIITISILFAFLHQRHTPILAIFAAPFLSEKLSWLVYRIKFKNLLKSQISLILITATIIFLISFQLFSTINKHIKSGFNIVVDPGRYPVRAVSFLKDMKIKGNLLVPFDWGEYAIWHLFPSCRVSVDGRFRTVYPEKVLEDHLNTLYNPSEFIPMLERYPFEILLLQKKYVPRELIEMSEKWVFIYADNTAFIFLENNKNMEKIIQRIKAGDVQDIGKEISVYFP